MPVEKRSATAATNIHADSSATGPVRHHETTRSSTFADRVPPAFRPAAVLVDGVVKAATPLLNALWTATGKMGQAGIYVGAAVLPLVLWAASKWLQWYIMSYVNKAVRVFKWVVWLLGFLPKGDAAGA